MTSSDVLAYVRQIGPDISQNDTAIFNFMDQANRRVVKKVLWPDCWLTTETVPFQQEYTSLPVLQVHAVYVGGQLASPTDRATLEGRQIGVYSQVAPSQQRGFPIPPQAGFTGSVSLGGTITPGDTLTTTVGGTTIPYVVQNTDANLQVLAQSIAYACSQVAALQNKCFFSAAIGNPGQLIITQLPNTGGPLSLAVSTSVGATETYVASGAALAGASEGSGGAPGTIGPWAPSWVIAQEPLTYPVQNTWSRSIRPDSQPWGLSCNQPPRYYWRGGKVGVVPNTTSPGVVIALDCVRSPDQITRAGQVLTVPDDWKACIAADVMRQCYIGDADSKHIQLAQMWESSYKDYEKEILLWRGTFEGEGPGGPKIQTQRFRMGLGGGSRFHRRGRW